MSITVASTYAWTIVAQVSELFREMWVFLQKQLRILISSLMPAPEKGTKN